MTGAQMEFLAEIDPAMSENLKAAVIALREGKPVLLLDDSARENEGDLIIAAEKITPETMNFLIKQGSGVVCLAMPKNRLNELGLPLMIHDNTNFFNTAFTVSIEASSGVTTGVSAKDRAHTILTAIDDKAQAQDLARPGHVFPLAAKQNGVFERMGHTEGSVDLMKIAKLKAGAVLCELMNSDGSMTVGDDRKRFAKQFSMPVVSVEEILFHRIKTENVVERIHTKQISSLFGSLCWQRLCFSSSLMVDIFTRDGFAPATNQTTRVSLARGDNLVGRLLGAVLEHCQDDPLVQSLKMLAQDKCDVVFFATAELPVANSREQQKNLYASICRALQDLHFKNVQFCEPCDELKNIATNNFKLNINE